MSKTMTNKEFNKSKEDKRQMFFDMQEYPDCYTDEQVERLLADEDVKDFFHGMAMARMAGKKPIRKRWMWMGLGRNLFRHITRVRWR